MSRFLIFAGLQAYALGMALYQWSLQGVRTDEAKYLLDIPYPQPPLGRFILGWTEVLPFQELLWRIVIASLLVHSVFLIWRMASKTSRTSRFFLCLAWLLSAAVLIQMGTIMMAPVTAVQGLILVALAYFLPLRGSRWVPFGIALLWLASLFTAYQAVLYVPLVIDALRRAKTSWKEQILYVLGPVILVFAYAFTNPLIIASFHNAGTENENVQFYLWFWYLGRLMLSGGSAILTVMGIWGMIRYRHFGLIGSFVLLSLFCFISFREYYDILYTPLFIGGAIFFFQQRKNRSYPFLPLAAGLIASTILLLWLFPWMTLPGPARAVIQEIVARNQTGTILIQGSFGHHWQYESKIPIERYKPESLSSAQAAICLNSCENIDPTWIKIRDEPEVWVKP